MDVIVIVSYFIGLICAFSYYGWVYVKAEEDEYFDHPWYIGCCFLWFLFVLIVIAMYILQYTVSTATYPARLLKCKRLKKCKPKFLLDI